MRPERFDELLMRWQEGEASMAELGELESFLRTDPACRRALVGSVLLEAGLYAKYATARPARMRFPLEAVAAVLAVAGAVFAVSLLLFRNEIALRPELPRVEVSRPVADNPPAIPAELRRRVETASYTLVEAIEKATRIAPGVVVAAVLEDEDGRVAFAVKIFQGGKLREINLHPKSGAVLENEIEEDEDPSRIVAAAKIPLNGAIWQANQLLPGIVLEAELELKGGRAVAEIEILSGGRTREIVVDAVTGLILEVKP